MGFEEEGSIEKPSQKPAGTGSSMTLAKAVELGEYDPEFLATFAEWHGLPRHIQFQYVRQALDNRHRHLITQWAEVNNMLDFSKKPHLSEALENIMAQIKKLEKDREKLYLEYSK
ncbi:MAG: hypothetical protein UT19_C0004G0093 [Candidatus Woesebacteria bacterium GW2011_GWB1_39_10b]|uniref:Uncharacterized protein n=3 Tax=Candidatus Woeseibacteriota TaxID=1752722 RepID=A0A0G0N388_9BACT|nr:MAG: hypothetical protein UT19_C0004G0093 [Candidatus Woesebacteria bacterium GW2011_GWB1_39_10b]KKR10684.1 MAG: hypothetical protein UT40_C0046G0003 [Candidatus Woesebacteria bacterium GW2011_GWA1_39_21b]OGM63651.1 MAG: hypothetical protein A3A52_02395 [Candidatus Woesebacteria bacterium RIFCSPLOWO2_01_FULL_39_14]